jgi:hypothetical protein
LKAASAYMWASTIDGKKQWNNYKNTALDMMPDKAYWAPDVQDFKVEINNKSIVAKTIPKKSPYEVDLKSIGKESGCKSIALSWIIFEADPSVRWDMFSDPDIMLSIISKSGGTYESWPTEDDEKAIWKFDPVIYTAGQVFDLLAEDIDTIFDEKIARMQVVVPSTLENSSWAFQVGGSKATFMGKCLK